MFSYNISFIGKQSKFFCGVTVANHCKYLPFNSSLMPQVSLSLKSQCAWSWGAVQERRFCFGPPFSISKKCEVGMNQGGGGGGEGQGPTLLASFFYYL